MTDPRMMTPRERAETAPSAAGREAAEMLLTTIDNQKLRGEEAFQLAALDFDNFAAERIRALLAETPETIEAIIKADFMEWGVYGGYNQETKEAEWQRMRRIEVNTFTRRLAALRRKALGE